MNQVQRKFQYFYFSSCLKSTQKLDYVSFTAKKHIFYIPTILKTTKSGRHKALSILEKFPSNKIFCIVDCIDKYMTFAPRESQPDEPRMLFLLSYAPPHKWVTSATVERSSRRLDTSACSKFHQKCINRGHK